jgi:Phage integrase family
VNGTRHVTTLKTVWNTIREKAWIKGRCHYNRHTLITELAESGAGDQTIMDIAGHVSKQMLKHYSHIRMEAKRNALEAIVRQPNGIMESLAAPADGSPQESPQRSQDRIQRQTNGHAPTPRDNSIVPKSIEGDCSELPGFTRDFEAGYPQNPHNRVLLKVIALSTESVSC